MKRIHVACEGQTELMFVRDILKSEFPGLHLIPFLPGKFRAKTQRGGDIRYARVRPDIEIALKKDSACYCTTMFDYYALGNDFPSKEEPRGMSPEAKAVRIEHAVEDDIAQSLGPNFDPRRFRCFLAMHEFEGLLFSHPERLANGLYNPGLAAELRTIRQSVETPEHIDDSPETAPSKRLKRLCSGYDKVAGGNVAALAVGIQAMKQECPHFRGWLGWLECLEQRNADE